MPKIKQLSLHEAHKIAAGEVIERPANIVKELVENALDACATSISVHIENGGMQLIRIVDNGCGMDEQDAQACFAKHATSKITHVDELETINTFGFRGEALASVAAVARVSLITKQADALAGIKVSVAASEIIDMQPLSAITGTDISVSDLFYTMPARKKFLKKEETEWRHILQLFQAFCLAFPSVHFKLYHNNIIIHQCPPVHEASLRFAQLWQQHHILSITNKRIDGTLSVDGAISTHAHYRYDRNALFFFVNNRWIKNFALANALLKGYQGIIPPGKYPMACIKITIDQTLVDVNIHPRKEEVAFIYPQKVTQLITASIKQALEKQISTHIGFAPSANGATSSRQAIPAEHTQTVHAPFKTSVTDFTRTQPAVFTPFDFDKIAENLVPVSYAENPALDTTQTFMRTQSVRYVLPSVSTTAQSPSAAPWTYTQPKFTETASEQSMPAELHNTNLSQHIADSPTSTHSLNTTAHTNAHTDEGPQHNYYQQTISERQNTHTEPIFTIIGQLHKTYILIEQEDGLFLVDQHAAHERILYELFSSTFNNCATINLMFPLIIVLSHNDYETVWPHLSLFKQNGITIEPFGNNQLIINSTPVHLKNVNLEEIIKQVVGWINEQGSVDHADFFKTINEKLHAQLACKAAIKAGDTINLIQMQTLLVDLHKTSNRFTCPHGRPTGFMLSLDEIEKKIKRKK